MRGRFLAVGLLAAGAAVGWAARGEPPPERFARYVDHGAKQGDIDDLAPVLHVERYTGQVQLNSGFGKVALTLAGYKEGKPVQLPDAEAELPIEAPTSCTLKYAVHVVDLDFLRLGDAKKNHCRLRVTMRGPEGERVWFERDIPKDVIDLSGCSNIGFTERAATHDEVPLFYFKNRGAIFAGPDVVTKEQVVEKVAKEGSTLIFSLVFGNKVKAKGRP